MNDWTQGYVSDIEYLPGFYAEQTPAHLDAVCMLRGVEPPVAQGQPFTYCELGCGVAETALVIAAANPKSHVWGFDFNPAHIARARALAETGKVGNIQLEEASFEELNAGKVSGLPSFDYIALHGVWSWVSLENRQHIVRFIDRYLKPGGMVYVTYNALPGWASVIPLQRMLLMFSGVGHDRSDRRVVQSLERALQFADAGAVGLSEEMLKGLKKERDNANVAYLSHEYLNEHWAPCYQMDVARDLSGAKLSFVGTANLLENFPDLSLSGEQRDLLAQLPPALSETARDYFLQRTFRRDIYMRGARPIPERRLDHRISEKRLSLVIPPSAITRTVKIPRGEATLNEGFYTPAFEALTEKPHTIGELRDLPHAAAKSASPREVLGMMVGTRQAMLMPNSISEEALAGVRAFNLAHLAACADEGRAVCALAAAATGSAVTVRLIEMLAYEVLVTGTAPDIEALTDAMWALLEKRGDRLRQEGELIQDAEENRRILRENAEVILAGALPLWQRIGAI